MNLHENSDFGRKVFFLYPPYSIETNVLNQLYTKEFEIYILNDIQKVKGILKHFPDSILYINIDETINATMTIRGWFNFIQSFNNDPELSTIFLGVISQRASKENKELFLINSTLPAGFIPLNVAFEDLITNFNDILSINGAMGRRKYIRANCTKNKATAIVLIGQKKYSLPIINISSVGMACILPKDEAFQVNMVIRNASLLLGSKDVKANIAIFKLIPNSDTNTAVFLFMKVLLHSTKEIIHAFIRSCLKTYIDSIAVAEKPDLTDYNKMKAPEVIKTNSISYNDDVDEIEELEEVQDIDWSEADKFSVQDLGTTDLF